MTSAVFDISPKPHLSLGGSALPCAEGPTLTALSTQSGHYSVDFSWHSLGPPTHPISGLRGPTGTALHPAYHSNCSSLCPWGCLSLSLILPSTSFLKTTSASAPNTGPGGRGGGGNSLSAKGTGTPSAFVWAAQPRRLSPLGQAMLPACWRLKEGRVGGRAWAGLGWQQPPGTAWPTQAGGRPKPGT